MYQPMAFTDFKEPFLNFGEPSSLVIIFPVTGFPSSLFRAFFKAGSATGDYTLTFFLKGGNDIKTFVSVHN